MRVSLLKILFNKVHRIIYNVHGFCHSIYVFMSFVFGNQEDKFVHGYYGLKYNFADNHLFKYN